MAQIFSQRARFGEKIILITCQIDDFWRNKFSKELEENITQLISDKKHGFSFPWSKIYTKNFAETPGLRYANDRFPMQHMGIFRMSSEENLFWLGWKPTPAGVILEGTQEFKILDVHFKNTAYQYDNWFFNRQHFNNKLKNHCEWGPHSLKSPGEAFIKKILGKAKAYGARYVDLSFHPQEVQALIRDHLTPDYLGWDFFKVCIPTISIRTPAQEE